MVVVERCRAEDAERRTLLRFQHCEQDSQDWPRTLAKLAAQGGVKDTPTRVWGTAGVVGALRHPNRLHCGLPGRAGFIGVPQRLVANFERMLRYAMIAGVQRMLRYVVCYLNVCCDMLYVI